MTTSNVSVPSVSVSSALVYVTREVTSENGAVSTVVELDREASKAAFLAACDRAEEKRTLGSTKIREAIAQVFAEREGKNGPIDDIASAAAYLLNNGGTFQSLQTWTQDVLSFIDENSASEKKGDSLAGKLYLKGAGRTGLALITEKFLTDRAIAQAKAAEKAAKTAQG